MPSISQKLYNLNKEPNAKLPELDDDDDNDDEEDEANADEEEDEATGAPKPMLVTPKLPLAVLPLLPLFSSHAISSCNASTCS